MGGGNGSVGKAEWQCWLRGTTMLDRENGSSIRDKWQQGQMIGSERTNGESGQGWMAKLGEG